MYDDLRRSPEDNPTKYKLVLPSEEELRAELVREQRLLAENMIDGDVEGEQL